MTLKNPNFILQNNDNLTASQASTAQEVFC